MVSKEGISFTHSVLIRSYMFVFYFSMNPQLTFSSRNKKTFVIILNIGTLTSDQSV